MSKAPSTVVDCCQSQARVLAKPCAVVCNCSLPCQLEVRSTPTTLVFDGGEEMGRVLGYRSRSWLGEMIEAEFPAN